MDFSFFLLEPFFGLLDHWYYMSGYKMSVHTTTHAHLSENHVYASAKCICLVVFFHLKLKQKM